MDEKVFYEIIELGYTIIPDVLHNEWSEYINQYKTLDSNDIIEFLSDCRTITSYLLKFKDNLGISVAQDFYSQFRYKNNYTKRLASTIAKFAPYPQNIKFIQGYYECFCDITQAEESALTEEINQIKRLNTIINNGLNFEEAEYLSRAQIFDLDINGQVNHIIDWENGLYRGVGENNELIIYQSIDDTFDVIYFIYDNGTYERLISRHQKLTPKGIIPVKSILTKQNNEIVSIDNYEILIKANFMDLENKVNYYKKIEQTENIINSKVKLEVFKELSQLSQIIDEDNHHVCSAIFYKLLNKETNANKNIL